MGWGRIRRRLTKFMTPTLFDKCVAGSHAATMFFPEIVAQLTADGVEWYSANLILKASTAYAADGAHHQVQWPGGHALAIADKFQAGKVQEAIRASQRGEITYLQFLDLVAAAGTVYYTVHLAGRKAIYFGRHGEFHVELFPTAK